MAAPAGQFALACDLGLDKVMIYKFNEADATLTPNQPPFATVTPGSGPRRHLAFSPDGKKTACVISEMACKVTVFDWDGSNGKTSIAPVGSAIAAGHVSASPPLPRRKSPIGPMAGLSMQRCADPTTYQCWRWTRRTRKSFTGSKSAVRRQFPRGMDIDPSGHWLRLVGNQKSRNGHGFWH